MDNHSAEKFFKKNSKPTSDFSKKSKFSNQVEDDEDANLNVVRAYTASTSGQLHSACSSNSIKARLGKPVNATYQNIYPQKIESSEDILDIEYSPFIDNEINYMTDNSGI